MDKHSQAQQRLLELGFIPVEVEFEKSGWQLIRQNENNCPKPILWLRHAPLIGDEVIFRTQDRHYIGRVSRRAFESIPSSDAVKLDPFYLCTKLVLLLADLRTCPDPADETVWEEFDDG